jgi:hypothetical protein
MALRRLLLEDGAFLLLEDGESRLLLDYRQRQTYLSSITRNRHRAVTTQSPLSKLF